MGSQIKGGTHGNSKTSIFLSFMKFGCIYGGFENFGIWQFSTNFGKFLIFPPFSRFDPLKPKKVSFYMCMERGVMPVKRAPVKVHRSKTAPAGVA